MQNQTSTPRSTLPSIKKLSEQRGNRTILNVANIGGRVITAKVNQPLTMPPESNWWVQTLTEEELKNNCSDLTMWLKYLPDNTPFTLIIPKELVDAPNYSWYNLINAALQRAEQGEVVLFQTLSGTKGHRCSEPLIKNVHSVLCARDNHFTLIRDLDTRFNRGGMFNRNIAINLVL